MNSHLETRNPVSAVGQTVQLRLYPTRPIWQLGPGWAAVGGFLASGAFSFLPQQFLALLLVWLIADPLLGTAWSLGAARNGIWRRLLDADLPRQAKPLLVLPYTQANSPAGGLARDLGRFRLWWQEKFWPQSGTEFLAALNAACLAALLALVLGLRPMMYVLLSLLLSWLVVLLAHRADTATSVPRALTTALQALGEFGIPWIIGSLALGHPVWIGLAVGACYTIAYFGLSYQAHRFRWLGASQAAVVALLLGLRHPLTATTIAVLLLVQYGLHVWTDYAKGAAPYAQWVQPFVLIGMLATGLTLTF